MINRTNSVMLALTCILTLPVAHGQDAAEPTDRGPGIRFGRPTPLAKTDDAIRIASYNVLNLFDEADDPALQGKYDDLPMATSRDRCASVAKIIRSIDADVLCLQEVESEAALRWFRDEFLDGMGYDHIASKDVGYYRGVEQSVLSRHPITAVTTWPDEGLADMEMKKQGDGWARDGEPPTKFQRSPLMVDIAIPAGRGEPAYELTMVVVHHKSGRFRRQRESEALQLVELLDTRLKAEPDLNLVIAGDFNAGPFDRSVGVYNDAGYVNAYTHRWKQEGDTRALFRTHESDRVIDFLMIHPNADSEVVDRTFQIVGSLHPGDDYDWRKDEPPSGYAADHYPLVLDLRPREVTDEASP